MKKEPILSVKDLSVSFQMYDNGLEKYDLKVIYDAAHAFGIQYKGRGIGSYGDASMFSFHATKVFNTIEGGAICFGDNQLEGKLYRLKNFGIRDEVTVDGVGANAKMNEFQAAMGVCNLRHVEDEIEKRKKVVNRYKERLQNVKGLYLSMDQENVKSNYAYFPVVFDEIDFGATRNEVCDRLKEDNIYARKYFYPLTNTFECFNGLYNVEETPIALHISKRILTLPLFADLTLDNVDRICDIVLSLRKI